MPNPCPPWAAQHSHGPFRVTLRVAMAPGYRDRFTTPAEGLPVAEVSELHLALHQAFDTAPANCTVTVTGTTPLGGREGRTVTAQIGADQIHQGLADPQAAATDPQLWTVQVWIYAVNPISPEPLDYPNAARQWATHITTITTTSGAAGTVIPVGVAVLEGGQWLPVPDPTAPPATASPSQLTTRLDSPSAQQRASDDFTDMAHPRRSARTVTVTPTQ